MLTASLSDGGRFLQPLWLAGFQEVEASETMSVPRAFHCGFPLRFLVLEFCHVFFELILFVSFRVLICFSYTADLFTQSLQSTL